MNAKCIYQQTMGEIQSLKNDFLLLSALLLSKITKINNEMDMTYVEKSSYTWTLIDKTKRVNYIILL